MATPNLYQTGEHRIYARIFLVGAIIWTLMLAVASSLMILQLPELHPHWVGLVTIIIIAWIIGLGGMVHGWIVFRRVDAGRDAARDELRKAVEEAAESNRAKGAFLATVSHEIRTPMNGVVGMTGLLLDSQLSEEQRRNAELIRSSAEVMLRLLNDVLDFSKIEAGKLELERIPFNPRAVVEDAVELLKVRSMEKKLSFRCDIDGRVPSEVLGDPTRVRQIIVNLVDNAFKFTQQGEVVIHLGRERETAESVSLLFSVTDTGAGIPDEKRSRLFKEFSQMEASTSRLHGGSGLGLAICNRLAEAMGSKIMVESQQDLGSTFWMVIKFGKPGSIAAEEGQAEPSGAAAVLQARPSRVLLADDNRTDQHVVQGLLRKHGKTVEVVSDGLQAVAAAGAGGFDLIVMDLEMPGLNGRDAAKAIRRRESVSGRRVPIIAITAHPAAELKEQCVAAGMDEVLSKPLRETELLRVLQRLAT